MQQVNRRDKYAKYGVCFIVPFIVVFLLFQAYPIINTLILSLSNLHGFTNTYDIIGFSNYVSVLKDPIFRAAFLNTIIIWGMNFIPQIFMALFLASIFTSVRVRYKAEGFFKAVFYLPNIITAASIAIIFRILFQFPQGPINQILLDWGVSKPFEFFRSVWTTRGIVAFIQFFMWYGHTMIIMMAAIKSIDPGLFETAMIDGASGTQIFGKITLPLIKPVVLYTLVTSLVGGMQMFDIPYLITDTRGSPNGSINTLGMFIYNQAFRGSRNFDIAATVSVYLLITVGIITVLLFRVFRERETRIEK